MQILLIADEAQKQEWLGETDPAASLHWIAAPSDHDGQGPDACIDLGFDASRERLDFLRGLGSELVVINSVARTLAETDASFVRICGWKSFLRGRVVEAAAPDDKRKNAEEILAWFGKQVQWVPDIPGLITPRVISMIINEAFLALEEGVSSAAEIDIAMKLGTNYPFGPFEWADQIGLVHVAALLNQLAAKEPRYRPANNLLEQARH